MLVRAARRKLQQNSSRHIQPAYEQLRLPWLCPAQLRYDSQIRKRSTVTPSSTATLDGTIKKNPADIRRPLSKRHLASAAAGEHRTALDDYVPFDHDRLLPPSPPAAQPPWLQGRSRSDLRELNPSNPLIINTSLATAPRKFRNYQGVSGDLEEIHLTLDACLRVGNLQRAAALLQRLMKIYIPESPELLEAHNQYLKANVEHIIRYKDQDLLKALQKWFQIEIRLRETVPDATTYALLLKASLQISQRPKMERTVRRYMELAQQAQLRDEVLSLPILTETDLGLISQFCPMDFSRTYEDAAFELFASPSTLNDNSSPIPPSDGSAKSLDVPEVKSMQQKGLGLDTLKKSLASFTAVRRHTVYPDITNMPPGAIDKSEAYHLQELLEEGAVSSALERWRTDSQKLAKLGVNSVLQTVPINALMWEWQTALVPLLRRELEKITEAEMKKSKSASDAERCFYGPFLKFLPAETLAAVTIISTMNELCAVGADVGVKLAQLIMHLGAVVQHESFAENLRRGGDSVWQTTASGNRQKKLAKVVKKHQMPNIGTKQLVNNMLRVEQPQHKRWTANIKAKVGAVLVSNLIQTARMDIHLKHPKTGEQIMQRQPVFYHGHHYVAGRRVGLIRLNPEMIKKLSREPIGGLVAKHMPMIVEPKPWKTIDEGGFLASGVEAIRMKHGDIHQKQYAKAAAEKGDMDQVFAGLDVLAKTAWKINREVFDVMLESWNSGEAVANLAPEKPDIVYPEEPKTDDETTYGLWIKQMKTAENLKSGLHSQRCFQNFQLEIARSFLNQTFYFPHNVDFRGRAYPIPPYFNHMGADNSRGLLMFAKGKELGAVGLTWLKVHLSNVFGFDKASFKERHDFTMDHLPDIYDSATNPLTGGRWWLKAEDPWQCLAACFELKKALDSPEPARFISHLAIHQDGTCNGLQHYAALGGDSLGARQVNLEPGDRPSDIYTAVAEMIKKEITEEAAQGNEVAKVLDGKISRKVVKATVMTNVYGVTYTGARRQVRKQLEEIMPDLPFDAGVNHGVTSSYVAVKIFKSLSTMFNGAHDIQFWLGECANRISQSLTAEQLELLDVIASGETPAAREYMIPGRRDKMGHLQFKSSVIWTTPLKMPVVQPYRKTARFEVDTNLQRVSIVVPTLSDPVHKKKQLQGFPPNFIHSLDATHMLLSALKSDEVGLTFAAVHDSFWTHAADVDIMNRILRDAFIRMHSEDIIGRLAAEFAARYKGCMYLAAVHSQSATGKKIIQHRKLNRSWKMVGKGRRLEPKLRELVQERKRLKLLASDDPAEQEEGRNMVTPGSIFAANAHEEGLVVPDELQGSGIGDMPTRKTKLQADEQLEVGDVANADTLGEDTTFEMAQEDENAATQDEDGDEQTSAPDEEPEEDEEDDQPTNKLKRPKKVSYLRKTNVWLPLTFPPVPKKGDFDVSRLKDSQYFFS